MTNSSDNLIWNCAFGLSVLVAVATAILILGIPVLPSQLTQYCDNGPITKIMLVLFASCLLINFRNQQYLQEEGNRADKGFATDPTRGGLYLTGDGELGAHANRLYEIYGTRYEGELSQDVSLNLLRNRLIRREWFTNSSRQVLLTLGLIGTVVGLANSLQGLSDTMTVMSVEGSTSETPELSGGLSRAISGMGSAFSTTLLGALFGGVLLRVLSTCTTQSSEALVDKIEILAETQLIPVLRASSGDVSVRRNAMLEFQDQLIEKEEKRLRQITQRFEKLAAHLETISSMAQPFASSGMREDLPDSPRKQSRAFLADEGPLKAVIGIAIFLAVILYGFFSG